jgi:hypothetical protein
MLEGWGQGGILRYHRIELASYLAPQLPKCKSLGSNNDSPITIKWMVITQGDGIFEKLCKLCCVCG